MSEAISATSVYIVPGQRIKIKIPISTRNNNGFFAAQGSEPPKGYFEKQPRHSEMTRGFVVEDKNIGTIERTDADEAAVIYTHRQPYKNTIWFFAQTNEIAMINIISVPIHDHSSIVQGGPAYGTYFDDDIER